MIIYFNNNVDNTSVQIGDLAFYSSIDNSLDLLHDSGFVAGQDPVLIGEITQVNNDNIHVTPDNTTTIVPSGAFILFKKDGRVNKSGLKGYYAKVKIENHSTDKIELFSLSSEITESSK